MFQVNHHGLASSNNPTLLQTIKPTVAIMNNGHRKGCADTVVDALRASTRAIYQVHKNLNPGGKNTFPNRIANHEEACKAEVIHLGVHPDALTYEVMNNLALEMTRLAIDMKNHKMRVESIAARLDFDERRARALETVVQGRSTPSNGGSPSNSGPGGGGATDPARPRRRRRRHDAGPCGSHDTRDGAGGLRAPIDRRRRAPNCLQALFP